MRYALAFPDPISMELVRAIVRSGSHELAGAFSAGTRHEELNRLGVETLSDTATDVLGIRRVAAVIVGASGIPDARSELMRTLVQAEMPMLVVHPVGDMLFGFELQMAQQASSAPILPFFPEMYHPTLRKVATWIRQADTVAEHQTRQVQFDRWTTDRRESSVDSLFCRDALLLRLLLGRILRVSALRAWNSQPPGSTPSPTSVSPTVVPGHQSWSVQMLDERDRDIRWNLQFAERNRAELTIHAGQQSCRITMASDPAEWTGTIGDDKISPVDGPTTTDPNVVALATMADALQSKEGRRVADELWEQACRSVELADAVARSSRRGRAIDLYHEEHSEESTFKGVMAAGGCIALMVALVAIPIVAIGEQFLPDAEPGSRWLRFPWAVLLVVLLVFLALQLLRLAIKRP